MNLRKPKTQNFKVASGGHLKTKGRLKIYVSVFAVFLIFLLSRQLIAKSENVLKSGIYFSVEHEGGLRFHDLKNDTVSKVDIGYSSIGGLAYSKIAKVLAIVAASDHDAPTHFYLFSGNPNSLIKIPSSKTAEDLYRPVFDPEGKYLYALNYDLGIYRYSLVDQKWGGVKIENAPGLNPQRLSFSPKGNRFAISPAHFDGFLIGEIIQGRFVVKEQILKKFNSCISANWIDENRIVFAGRKKEGIQYLWIADLITGKVSQLTKGIPATRDFLSLSPDRLSVVFVGTDSDYDWRIWSINLDGTDLKKLTKSDESSGHLEPVWVE